MICIECEGNDLVTMAEYEDPRSPPYGEGKCLCRRCAMDAYHEAWMAFDDEQENLKYNYKLLFKEELPARNTDATSSLLA